MDAVATDNDDRWQQKMQMRGDPVTGKPGDFVPTEHASPGLQPMRWLGTHSQLSSQPRTDLLLHLYIGHW